jgi:hypothetical protein
MTGVVTVFAIIAAVIWLWREYVYRDLPTTPAPQHVHQPTVVADGTVDVCAGCGERLS